MSKYLCHCKEEIRTLVCSWNTDPYYGRPVLATSWLLCEKCGIEEHRKDIDHSQGRYNPYIDKIFKVYLNAPTKEVAVKQILAQVIPQLGILYLPKTDLKRTLKNVVKLGS